MKTNTPFLTLLLLCASLAVFSQEKNTGHVFQIENPDYELSPYTGMTKQHWKDAALYMLKGAFSYIENMDSPMKFPKLPGKSYPHNERRVPTEKLEGLCRTLFVASPILKEQPDLVLNNINVAEYYRYQISKLVDTTSKSYIVPRSKNGGPSQNLVEFGALALSLIISPDILWDPLPQTTKDALAKSMLSYGDGPTVDSNWKFFNIFVLSFFKDQGYKVNEKLMIKYLNRSLEHYRGDGWYNDSPAYDYYSMWAFQMYGSIWAQYIGNKYYPEIAQKFKDNFRDLKTSYPYMFSRDGKMIMWGRSISYRIGSVVPFPLMGFDYDDAVNYGWMRRISSGVIKQFFEHPDFMKDKVPTLGFYGHFEPAVQNYSCRGSVYWMGKAFLGLMVPDDSPFWTAKENEGAWETELSDGKVSNKFLAGSELLITDYPNIGASEMRSWCHEKVKDDWQKFRSTENYNRLSYNSAFPWQADGKNGEVAMNYVIKNKKEQWEAFRLYTFKKFEDEVYYRDVVLETNENVKFSLADIPLNNGILRVDKNNSTEAFDMRLGHYALPKFDKEITTTIKKVKGYEVTIIDNGVYQLAMVPVLGWQNTEVIEATGLHPESESSKVINVTANFSPDNKNTVFATLMLWKKSGKAFSKKELMPVEKIKAHEGKVEIKIKGEPLKVITY